MTVVLFLALARFLGSPVDHVVFDGLDDGHECREVVLVEVKTGRARLNARERRVRDAVESGRVSYRVIRLEGIAESEVLAGVEAPRALPS